MFVVKLVREFEEKRQSILHNRTERGRAIDSGIWPDFLSETAAVRSADWTVSPLPRDLQDRRVEITGPSGDRKMVVNALNSGATVFMADFEDALSPTWQNVIEGQINMRDAIRRTIEYVSPQGKKYQLNDRVAVLMARPRGWHLVEKHVMVDGKPVSASLFDFGLYFYHNAKQLLENGSGPYFYLPKLESHLEARLWNDVFVFSQRELGIMQGSIKATVLIETILAAFEMDEILYELRDHAAGLNCGRWDYIFSYIKTFRNQPDIIVPDRSCVTMTSPFMRAYSLLTIRTCHRRNAHAIGGMAAQIPIHGDQAANEEAMTKVRADKLREVTDGHDGTWVAHPGLVPIAMNVFNANMSGPNQIDRKRLDVQVASRDLLAVPEGPITETGLRINISVGIRYIANWMNGSGAVPIYNLMEDAATAEISRAQIWQWIRHPRGVLTDGRKVTVGLFTKLLLEELGKMESEMSSEEYATGKYDLAAQLFSKLTIDDAFALFLTTPGYVYLD